MGEAGYRGYRWKRFRSGLYLIVTPLGDSIAEVRFTHPTLECTPSFEGLDCGSGHKSRDEAIKYIARQHIRLTTTKMERFRSGVYRLVSSAIWGFVAAIVAVYLAVSAHCPNSGGTGAP